METGALSYMPHHRTSQGVINNISLMDLVTLSDLGVARGDNVPWSTIKTMILMMINILQRAAQHPPQMPLSSSTQLITPINTVHWDMVV
jgi:hypothetical protein